MSEVEEELVESSSGSEESGSEETVSSDEEDAPWHALRSSALALSAKEDHAAAAAAWELAAASVPPQQYHERAECLLQRANALLAVPAAGPDGCLAVERAADAVIGADPSWFAGFVERGKARRSIGRLLDAAADFETALELEPPAEQEAVCRQAIAELRDELKGGRAKPAKKPTVGAGSMSAAAAESDLLATEAKSAAVTRHRAHKEQAKSIQAKALAAKKPADADSTVAAGKGPVTSHVTEKSVAAGSKWQEVKLRAVKLQQKGRSAAGTDENRQASADFARAAELAPNGRQKAICYMLQSEAINSLVKKCPGEEEHSKSMLEAATRSCNADKSFYGGLSARGFAYCTLGEWSSAVSDFEAALKQDHPEQARSSIRQKLDAARDKAAASKKEKARAKAAEKKKRQRAAKNERNAEMKAEERKAEAARKAEQLIADEAKRLEQRKEAAIAAKAENSQRILAEAEDRLVKAKEKQARAVAEAERLILEADEADKKARQAEEEFVRDAKLAIEAKEHRKMELVESSARLKHERLGLAAAAPQFTGNAAIVTGWSCHETIRNFVLPLDLASLEPAAGGGLGPPTIQQLAQIFEANQIDGDELLLLSEASLRAYMRIMEKACLDVDWVRARKVIVKAKVALVGPLSPLDGGHTHAAPPAPRTPQPGGTEGCAFGGIHECPICFEVYSEDVHTPRVFRCGHTVCELCAEALLLQQHPGMAAEKKKRLECPTCEFPTRVANAQELAKNFALVAS